MSRTDTDRRWGQEAVGLWQRSNFLKLWAGQSVSLLGSEITLLALPLTAILVLQAPPLELGILSAVQSAPFLLLSLPAGVWVDRLHRQRLLILCDVGRAAVLGVVPVAAFTHSLRIELLYAVGFCAGALTAVFDVGYQSFLPQVVVRGALVAGNTRLEISRAVAQVSGPSAAGVLIQWLTAPIAIAADAASFVVSALSLASVHALEPATATPRDRRNPIDQMREGFALVLHSPVLRTLAGVGSAYNLFGNVLFAVFLIYLTRDFQLPPAVVGLILSVAGPAGLIGALLASHVARRFGFGPTLVGALAVGATGRALILLAGGPPYLVVACLMASRALLSVWVPVYSVSSLSFRQATVPDHLQGR